MIAISDTSVMHYLVLLEAAHVLPILFKEVTITSAIHREPSHPNAPERVRQFATDRPTWLRIEVLPSIDPSLDLDIGETEAISLALSLKADMLLIDDLKGRRRANDRGLTTVGTLTVLRTAAERQLVDLKTSFDRLSHTNFRVSKQLLTKILDEFEKRTLS